MANTDYGMSGPAGTGTGDLQIAAGNLHGSPQFDVDTEFLVNAGAAGADEGVVAAEAAAVCHDCLRSD